MIYRLIIAGLLVTTSSIATMKTNTFGITIFTKCDENKDNFLDKKEYLRMSSKRFNRMDSNRDKNVTIKEIKSTKLAKIMPKIAISWFKRNDLNDDFIVTYSEMKQSSDIKFNKIDTNKDKKLSTIEWQTSNPSFKK